MEDKKNILFKIATIYFLMYFSYQIGLVSLIFEDQSNSFSLNTKLDFPLYNEQEVLGANWLYSEKNENLNVYTDEYRSYLLFENGRSNINIFIPDSTIKPNYYIFTGTYNINNDKILLFSKTKDKYTDLTGITQNKDRLYDNRKAQIYLS